MSRRTGEGKSRFQELGHEVEFGRDTSRNVYIASHGRSSVMSNLAIGREPRLVLLS